MFRLIRGKKRYPGTLDPGGNPPIQFEAGPYLGERSSFVGDTVFGDDGLWISLGSRGGTAPSIVGGMDLPFEIWAGAGGARIDLSTLSIDLGIGFFNCETRATYCVADAPTAVSFFKRGWTLQPAAITLRNGSFTSEVVFAPIASGQRLPISIDLQNRGDPPSAENPLMPAQSLSGNLRLEFSRTANTSIELRQAWLEPPAGGGIELSTHFLVSPDGAASRWAITGRVPLHLRTGNIDAPSTFLIGPIGAGLPATSLTSVAALHGPLTGAEFRLSGNAAVRCERREPQLTVADHVNASLATELTAPFLTEERASLLIHAKPGQTYRLSRSSDPQTDVLTLDFPGIGPGLGIPLSPDFQFAQYQTLRTAAYEDLDIRARDLSKISLQEAAHETLLLEGSPPTKPQDLKINRLFGEAAAPFAPKTVGISGTGLRLDPHTIRRSYGDIWVEHPVGPGDALDYVLLFENDVTLGGNFNFPPAPAVTSLVISGQPLGVGSTANKLLGILKLSSAFALEDILRREDARITQHAGAWDWRGFLRATLQDEALKYSGWLGMLLFETPIDISAFTVLNGMVPNTLRLGYLALTPQKVGQDGKQQPYSVAARVRLDVEATEPDASADAEEARFRLRLLDMIFRDSSLTTFRTEATLVFGSMFGAVNPAPQPEVRIVGSYDQPKNTFRFLGELPYEQAVFPSSTGYGPIKQVYVSSAEVVETNGLARINLNGRIETRPFAMGGIDWFEGGSSPDLSFRRLGLTLPSATLPSWRWLKIDYPSLSLNIDGPQFRLLDILDMKIVGLGVDWPDLDVPHVSWGELFPVWDAGSFDETRPAFNLKLRLDLMRLPELVARSLERLRLDFTLGFNLDWWDAAHLRASLTAVDFKGLDLELLRFLTIKAQGVELGSQQIDIGQGPKNVPFLSLKQVSVTVLDHRLINGLDALIYALPDGRVSFVCRLQDAADTEPLDVEWVLIGQNMFIPEALVKDILAIKPAADNAHVKGEIDKTWGLGVGHNGFLPLDPNSGRGEWIFGAGFSFFNDFIVGKFLFQDHTYYGLALDGKWLEDWFGWDFAISVLYIVGSRPEEDRFVIAMRVPSVTVPAFHFFGGVISVDIDMRGRFLLDIGFPWLRPDGSRNWDRTFGAIITPFQGTGGAYLANGLSKPGLPDDTLLMAGGVAVQFGIGGAYGGGVFRVWATAGIYFVAEGEFYLERQELVGVQLAGAAGILVRAGGELNFWIISAKVELTISAECRIVATWGKTYPLLLANAGPALVAGGPGIELAVSFVLYASAQASACIGGGWFKVCKGISVTIPLRYDCRLTMA
ncbi:hypothetical protein [Rhizobium leguminosarum]|uniref:hypothetical protein n=1 Tax=Rhizobium leguminosarum TaxID=384 RepID=UPI003F9E927D